LTAPDVYLQHIRDAIREIIDLTYKEETAR